MDSPLSLEGIGKLSALFCSYLHFMHICGFVAERYGHLFRLGVIWNLVIDIQ